MSCRYSTICLCIALILSIDLFAQEADQTTAPWDYRDHRYAFDVATVERHHFNQDVQMLIRGQSEDFPGPDLVFMLRYFPNHHGALYTMGRLWRIHRKSDKILPRGLSGEQTAAHFFELAISFVPDDGVVRMLYGNHLFLERKNDEALTQFEAALELSSDSPEVHYNAGLYFTSIGDYATAVEHASFAYSHGYPLPGLRRKLMKKGAWDGEFDRQ